MRLETGRPAGRKRPPKYMERFNKRPQTKQSINQAEMFSAFARQDSQKDKIQSLQVYWPSTPVVEATPDPSLSFALECYFVCVIFLSLVLSHSF